MKYKKITSLVVMVSAFSIQSCGFGGRNSISSDGINVITESRRGEYFIVKVSSSNPDFNCINLNGISGDNEFMYGLERRQSLVKSAEKYQKSDLKYFDNKPVDNIVRLNNSTKEIKLSANRNFISFPIFNCESYENDTSQYVYIYLNMLK